MCVHAYTYILTYIRGWIQTSLLYGTAAGDFSKPPKQVRIPSLPPPLYSEACPLLFLSPACCYSFLHCPGGGKSSIDSPAHSSCLRESWAHLGTAAVAMAMSESSSLPGPHGSRCGQEKPTCLLLLPLLPLLLSPCSLVGGAWSFPCPQDIGESSNSRWGRWVG